MCVGVQHAAMHAASAASDPGMAGMAGMDMPMDMPADHTPCDQSTTAGACQVMAPCSGGFLVVAAADLDRSVPGSSRIDRASSLAPPSRTRLPELPPPRA